MLPWFKQLKITDLYWSHARINETYLDGIRVHAFPLYPVRCEDYPAIIASGGKTSIERKYLYSFIGAYDSDLYLSPVRSWIFDLPIRPDAHILSRGEWHYEKKVYDEQIAGVTMNESECLAQAQYNHDYTEVLQDTIFSLCPSGSGPNSIRLWESLGFGCIPVLLSDQLRLPGDPDEWDKAIVQVPEQKRTVKQLPDILQSIASNPERLHKMQQAGRVLWKKYGDQGPITVLQELTRIDRIHEWVKV